jgi:hypothetical protein
MKDFELPAEDWHELWLGSDVQHLPSGCGSVRENLIEKQKHHPLPLFGSAPQALRIDPYQVRLLAQPRIPEDAAVSADGAHIAGPTATDRLKESTPNQSSQRLRRETVIGMSHDAPTNCCDALNEC